MSEVPSPKTGSAASRLFDIRLVVGALLAVYGVMLSIAGLVSNSAQRVKANGININLGMGIALLVFGILFLIWMRVNPLHPPVKTDMDATTTPDH